MDFKVYWRVIYLNERLLGLIYPQGASSLDTSLKHLFLPPSCPRLSKKQNSPPTQLYVLHSAASVQCWGAQVEWKRTGQAVLIFWVFLTCSLKDAFLRFSWVAWWLKDTHSNPRMFFGPKLRQNYRIVWWVIPESARLVKVMLLSKLLLLCNWDKLLMWM